MKQLIITLSILFSSAALAQVDQTQLEIILKEIRNEDPGVIIGILENGKTKTVAAKGLANLEERSFINPKTTFRISSTSKQFTAATILLLQNSGVLSTSDSLGKFYPEFSKEIAEITIQQLINHTSGLRDYMSLLMLKRSEQMDFFNNFTGSDEDVMTLVSQQQDLSFKPGTEHSYSNTNYWLLSQIVERVSGQSLAEYTQREIFDKLGMQSSRFITEKNSQVDALAYVSKCPDCEREEYEYKSFTVGDGGVVTNLEDLQKWEYEFFNCTILGDEFWNSMLRRGTLTNGEEIDYCSGIISGDFHGHQTYAHSGQNPGYSSDIIRIPETRTSIVILGNQNFYDTKAMSQEVLQLLLSPDLESEESAFETAQPFVLSDFDKGLLCGDYLFKETNEYRSIARTENGLEYVRANGPNSPLIPVDVNKLIFGERPNVSIELQLAPDGSKTIVWTDGTITMHASEVKKNKKVITEDFAQYAAQYINKELNITLELLQENDQLMLPIFDNQFPLSVIEEDKFNAMGMLTLRIERDHNSAITGFRLDAPRARNILFERY